MKRIKDPVRNQYIIVEEPYLSAMEQPEFQRLRRVSQLGLTDLVYPGATHSRLIHSLGVFYVMKQFTDSISVDEDTERQLEFAALLHDIGHGPFSHVSERVDSAPDHEERSCNIVEDFGDRGIILEEDIVPIQEFIRGERRPHLLHGDIDADRLDYLLRDSFNTGNSAGVIEDHTITTQNVMLTEDKEVAFHHTARSALSGIPQARQAMYSAVYVQPTVRIAERMLEESIIRSPVSGKDLMKLDDYELLTTLRSSVGITKELADKIANRNLYKMAASTRFFDEQEQLTASELKRQIIEETGIESHKVLIEEFPENPSSLSTKIVFDDGSVQDYEIEGSSSHIYNYDIGVFTTEENVEEVSDICDTFDF
jgi:HD superfamily phosphohydrolase